MRKIITMFSALLLFALLSTATGYAQVDVSTGGPATSYPDLSSAFAAINAGTHTGAIAIGISGNTTEAVSAVLNASGTGSASYSSIVITPTGGASRTISGAVTGHLIDLNGADNVTINGLNSGGNALIISNSAIGVSNALRFFGDATGNLITNCTLQGSGSSAGNGVVLFSGGTVSGNDNNTISYCNIGPAGANLPLNGIYSMGTSTEIDNSNNSVAMNLIFDYFNASTSTSGLNINSGNSAWSVTGNKLFQTANRIYTSSGTHYGIFISSGAGYTISDNVIGFANAEGTGTTNMIGLTTGTLGGTFPTAYTTGGTANATRYAAISCAFTAAGAVSSIQNNLIAGFALYTSSGAATTNGIFCGINITSGNANIGTITGNTIGSASGSIYTACTTSGGAIVGIYASSANTVNIQNNMITRLDAMGSSATTCGGITGINSAGTAGIFTITGNTIGGETNPDLRMGNLLEGTNLSNIGTTFSNSSGIGAFRGILNSATGLVTIGTVSAPNIIRNAYERTTSSSSTGSFFRGIENAASSGIASIVGNSIYNLSTFSANVTTSTATITGLGIYIASTTAGSVVSQNEIYDLALMNAGALGTNLTGIGVANATSLSISKNKIYGLSNASTSVSATAPGTASGIFLRSATTAISIFNNMISLGTGQSTNTSFIGIYGNHGSTPNPVCNIYYNSIYITGTSGGGAQPCFGYLRGDFSVTARTPTVDIRNNLIINDRTGGTSNYYAIANNYGTTASTTGWGANASNYNVLDAAASTVGYWNSNQTFATWQTTSASDVNSLTGIPATFVNAARADLHLSMGTTATQLESGCLAIPLLTTDFDGDTRPGPSGSVNGGAFAPDFGADEFDGVPLDLTGPMIVYTPLGNTASTSIRSLTVTITDFSGIPVVSPGWPNLYWKKTGDVGYTSVTPSAINGSQFTFNFGGGVSLGDVVQYYVAAQDNAPTKNVNVNPSAGASGFTADPPAAATPPTAPNFYNIGGIAGVFHVGAELVPPDYLTLTAAIADLNSKEMTGSVTFLLDDPAYAASETFPLIINSNPGASASNILTIKPNTGNTPAITGAIASAALILVKNNYTVIDGSNSGGTGRNMTIENTSATAPQVVRIGSTGTTPITNVTLKNCNIINGTTTSSAVVTYGADGTAGYFNNITIQNNSIQKAYMGSYNLAVIAPGNGSGLLIDGNNLDATGTNQIRLVGVYVQGVDGATVSGNSIGNIPDANAEYNRGIWFATGTINSTISGNTIYNLSYTSTSSYAPMGISLSSAVANANINITGNTITGLTSSGTGTTYGIYAFSTTSGVTIQKNKISNIKNTNTGGYPAAGIVLGSSLNPADMTVKNNFIWDVAANGWNSYTTDNGYGISITAGGGYNIYNNSVSLSTNQTSATGLPACFIVGSAVAGGLDVRNNIFSIDATVGTDRFAVICNAPTTVFSAIDNNDYFTSGTNVGYINAAPVADLAAWKTATGMDANSVSGDPKFVSPTDLHILTGVVTPVRSAGVSIASVTDDIDGNPRTNPPDIGAAEDGYAPISLGANLFNATCPGSDNGSISTIVGGGLAPYTYLWNTGATTDGISGLIAGAYSVTVTDALGTTKTGSWTITQPEAFFLYTEITPANCPSATDGSISMAVNGGTPSYTHVWSNGSTNEDISGLAPGDYSVTVTDYVGCVTTGTWTVGIVDPVCTNSSVSGVVTSTVCYDAHNTITVSGLTIQAPSGNATFIAGQNILFQPGTVVQSGAYMHGYISTIFCGPAKTPSAAVGQDEPETTMVHAAFTLYPNPTSGNFTIQQKGGKTFGYVQVEIYNMNGSKVMTDRMAGEQQREFTVSELPAGIYFVKLVADGWVETIKMVRTR